MLFRLVRPMRRTGSRNRYYVRRIPSDVKARAVGMSFAVPVGERVELVTITSRTQSVRVSLRTDDPAEVKTRQAAVDAQLETIFNALREDRPVVLTQRQATALAGELYRVWADGEATERTISIEEDRRIEFPDEHIYRVGPNGKRRPTGWRYTTSKPDPAEWEALLERWEAVQELDEEKKLRKLEELIGPLVDRLLLARGIRSVEPHSRELLLDAFWLALKDAFEHRKRNAAGDYSADPRAGRFPEWQSPQSPRVAPRKPAVSLTGLVEAWWTEAKATGRKPSTYESYKRTFAQLKDFVGHNDAARLTKADVVAFKDHRLASTNPRNGRPISARTVRHTDLAALNSVFGWAVVNGKLAANPAEGVVLKLGKRRTVRRGFSDAEAVKILSAASKLKRGQERPETFAAKRWVPWLLAYSGARVGEMAQLRKEDVSREGKHWVINVIPEAGTVKTDEHRRIVVHPHLIEMGFIKFVNGAPSGYLFLRPAKDGDVLGPLGGLKNRLAEFARPLVPDRAVDPNHGWRHRFKSVCRAVGIDPEVRDHIQGHRPRSEGERYGEMPLSAQAKAVSKLPLYKVT